MPAQPPFLTPTLRPAIGLPAASVSSRTRAAAASVKVITCRRRSFDAILLLRHPGSRPGVVLRSYSIGAPGLTGLGGGPVCEARHRGRNPRNRGVDAKRTGRRPRIHANSLQGLPIAVLSVFKGLEQELALVRTHASRLRSRGSGLLLVTLSHATAQGTNIAQNMTFANNFHSRVRA